MFAMKLYMFSIGTITIPTHIEPIPKPVNIPDIGITKLVQKLVKTLGVLVIKLTIPPNIVKQHLPETFFHLEVGEMIVDETLT
jgi:hypothetical protein